MNKTRHYLLLAIVLLFPFVSKAQAIDTLLDLGTHKIHFNIIPGKGTPILFEAGSGNDGSIWRELLVPVHEITGAPLITYDRAGMGKSEFNPTLPDDEKGYILHIIEDLEKGLQLLGYEKDITYVAHSYGGFCAAVFADRNPEKVKNIVLFDASLPCYFDDRMMQKFKDQDTPQYLEYLKSLSIGLYYESLAFDKTVALRRQVSFPEDISIMDIVAGFPPNGFGDPEDPKRWTSCHSEFALNNAQVTSLTAEDCGHYVFFYNRPLSVQSIVKSYVEGLPKKLSIPIMERSLNYSITGMNNIKAQAAEFRRSEDALNRWGYELLNGEDLEKALLILELNMLLYPESFNVYDSYGEALYKAGQKKEAIEMYKKSLELNPQNDNGKKMIEKITSE